MALTGPAGIASNFRTRTASVSLKVDIHPPPGININHVEGESTHSVVMNQAQEILNFIVFTELKSAGIEIPKHSSIYKNLLCTSRGFLLLRWEKLCRSVHHLTMSHCGHDSPLAIYLNQKCRCPRRKKPDGCNGFHCLVLNHISKYESFSTKVFQLMHHTVGACRWCLSSSADTVLLDRILDDSLEALDVVCMHHDDLCQDGWECVLRSSLPFKHRSDSRKSVLIIGAAAGISVIIALVFYKLRGK